MKYFTNIWKFYLGIPHILKYLQKYWNDISSSKLIALHFSVPPQFSVLRHSCTLLNWSFSINCVMAMASPYLLCTNSSNTLHCINQIHSYRQRIILLIVRILSSLNFQIVFVYLPPAHIDINRNSLADNVAKEAAHIQPYPDLLI